MVVLLFFLFSAAVFAQVGDSAARELFRLTNEARAKEGLSPLAWEDRLAAIALPHAREMARRKELSHQFPDEAPVRQRVISTGLRTNASGENVGFAESAREVHDAWMNSPGHRRNILDPRYNAMGIAMVRQGTVLWAVQDFARQLPQASEGDVEQMVASELARRRAAGHLAALPLADVPEVRREACRMGDEGTVNARAAVQSLPHSRSVFAFTASDPRELPDGLTRAAPSEAQRFAVGACFRKTDRYPEGTNWVVVAFY